MSELEQVLATVLIISNFKNVTYEYKISICVFTIKR